MNKTTRAQRINKRQDAIWESRNQSKKGSAAPEAVRRFKIGKYGLSESPLGQHVALNWKGRRLLGEVYDAQYNSTTGYIELSVKHFNGEDWPIKPVASAVEVISPTEALDKLVREGEVIETLSPEPREYVKRVAIQERSETQEAAQ